MTDLPRTACWRADDARHVLATEALEGSEAAFLATHFPITDFEIEGTRSAEVETCDEEGLYDALSSSDVRHAFCVVEGEPGSGKSHLIRWLRGRWSIEDDEVLLIQRLDGSLEGTLRQLQLKLPGLEARFEGFAARAQDLTATGQANEFFSNLVLALRHGHLTNPPPDQDWCEKFSLDQVLHPAEVMERWSAPRRIVELLSGRKGDEDRDQDLARFVLDDIAELEEILRPLPAPSPRAVRFLRELQKEAQGIRSLTDEEKSGSDNQEALRIRFENSAQLVDALNARRNGAVQNVLGISTEGLKEMFDTLRRELAPRRLVLLLEDITAWEGVDNQLIDVLVTNVETREDNDLCPMVSVVGLTPVYFQDRHFQANYRQRITHHVRLGHADSSGSFQEVSSLRTGDAQVRFAASYLRAIRAGRERLESWGGGPDPVPNTCDGCRYRTECHAAFGEERGVGLFPFNRQAIPELYKSLVDPTHRSTFQTPRGMLQGVLGPTLNDPYSIAAGEYPKATIVSSWIPEETQRIPTFTAETIAAKCHDEDVQERLARLLRFWGSCEAGAATTTLDDTGELRFGNVRRRIYDAFGLPWLGEDHPAHDDGGPTPPPRSETDARGWKAGDEHGQPSDDRVPDDRTDRNKRPNRADRPFRPVRTAELRRFQELLSRWRSGAPRQTEQLNRVAAELVLERLPWNRLDIPQWVRTRLFTRDLIILEGTRQARSTHFVLPNEDWVSRGIEAFLDLRDAGSALDRNELERHLRAYAAALLELEARVKEHAKLLLPALEDGMQWPLAATATQVLLARAWLRGVASPLDPPWQQWRNILAAEEEATSAPQERVDSWNETVERTRGSHGKHRTMLQSLVNLPQGDTDALAFADASIGAQAIEELSQSFRLSRVPTLTENLVTQIAELGYLIRDANETDQRLGKVPARERDRLKRLALIIDKSLRGLSVHDHVQRVDRVIEDVSNRLPNAAPRAVDEWKLRKAELGNLGFLDPDEDGPGRDVEDLVDGLLVSEMTLPEAQAELLDWLLRAPVRSLNVLHLALNSAEYAIGELHHFVATFLSEGPASQGSFREIQNAGERITTAASLMLAILRGSR